MTDVQAADAALGAAIRLLRDVNIIEKFTDVKQDSYSKNRPGQGPTPFYEKAKVIKGDKADVDRITNHVLGDACTPGNAKECTFRPRSPGRRPLHERRPGRTPSLMFESVEDGP